MDTLINVNKENSRKVQFNKDGRKQEAPEETEEDRQRRRE